MQNTNTPAVPMPHLAELLAAFEDAKGNFTLAREAALARKAEAAKMRRSADASPQKLRGLVAQEQAAYSLAELSGHGL